MNIIIKIVLIIVLLADVTYSIQARYRHIDLYDEIQCSVPGCKMCFTTDNCLLCDSNKNFMPKPI